MKKGKLVANRNCGPAWLVKDIENRIRSLVLSDTYSEVESAEKFYTVASP